MLCIYQIHIYKKYLAYYRFIKHFQEDTSYFHILRININEIYFFKNTDK